jgi:glycosyltransferase involved in cell wall biosynthesis
MVAEKPDEIIVVDYDCPENTQEWVNQNFPDVTVVKAFDATGFCASRARNIGARATRSDWIVFVDADVKLKGGIVDWIRANVAPGFYYLIDKQAKRRIGNMEGTVICRKTDFKKIGGYDEVFRLWGGEDKDFYARLIGSGVKRADYPAFEIESIKHDNALRLAQYEFDDFLKSNLITKIYFKIKSRIQSHELTGNERLRQDIFESVKSAISNTDIRVFNFIAISIRVGDQNKSVRVIFFRKFIFKGRWKTYIAVG